MLYPKLFTTLKDYSFQSFFSDLIAGIIVGIVAFPLAIAFGIASGVSPDKSLVTAIVAGFIISALGGSRVQIGGPTGAFVVIVYGIIQNYGAEGLLVTTLLAGVLLILMGFAGLGNAIRLIPQPVITGFTSGIAVIIFSSEVKDFLGLSINNLPADFIKKWLLLAQHLNTFNPHALLIALGSVVIIAFWPRVSRRIPGPLVALLFSAAAVKIFQLPVETIGTRFGALPSTLPAPKLPLFDFWKVQELIHPAITVALLGAIESLLSATVADGMTGGRHRPNMELVAQGTANIASAMFGGIPATGAIARTVTNIKNGGKTPVAGIIHSVTLLIMVLFLGKWAALIPLSCLAGILTVVAYNMSEWRSFAATLRGLLGSAAVMIVTFLTTIFFDLTVAIEIGLVMSLFLFMHRMAKVTQIRLIDEDQEVSEAESLYKIKVPQGVDVYEIDGPFFFGVAHQFEEAVRVVAKMPRVRILRLKNVPILDSTGLNALKSFHRKCRANHIHLLIAGLQPQPFEVLKKTEVYDLIGHENFYESVDDAIKQSRILVSQPAPKHSHP